MAGTYPEPNILSLLKDHEIRGIDELVVAAGANSEVHLITKLERVRGPVEVDQLHLPRRSDETYSTMISITE